QPPIIDQYEDRAAVGSPDHVAIFERLKGGRDRCRAGRRHDDRRRGWCDSADQFQRILFDPANGCRINRRGDGPPPLAAIGGWITDNEQLAARFYVEVYREGIGGWVGA